jgi:TBC1 domain family member 2
MPIIPLSSLKKLAWNGIPDPLRPLVWQILLGYLPCEASTRSNVLASKRKEYFRGVEAAFGEGTGGLDQAVWHQIRIDVPRTNPHLSLYQFEATQKVLSLACAVGQVVWTVSWRIGSRNYLLRGFSERRVILKKSFPSPISNHFFAQKDKLTYRPSKESSTSGQFNTPNPATSKA